MKSLKIKNYRFAHRQNMCLPQLMISENVFIRKKKHCHNILAMLWENLNVQAEACNKDCYLFSFSFLFYYYYFYFYYYYFFFFFGGGGSPKLPWCPNSPCFILMYTISHEFMQACSCLLHNSYQEEIKWHIHVHINCLNSTHIKEM